MFTVTTAIKKIVRRLLHHVAAGLNSLTDGRLTPNAVTICGLLMHVPVAWLIATGQHDALAAVLLIIFGLFDVLDGELARVQGSASAAGMLLDASTDRMKETLLYMGAAYVFASGHSPKTAVWAVAACGASLCVSYVKAKGEAAVAANKDKIEHAALNRMFADGLLTFELRMVVLVLGLLSHQLLWAVSIIAVLATITALQRLIRITRVLSRD
jgi:archaetidylinositol phosphate synthase